jgi:hypothetical protein
MYSLTVDDTLQHLEGVVAEVSPALVEDRS